MTLPTRTRIAQEALRLFAERGYDGATMGEIARRVGITDGAIYRHFESKKELFLACLEPAVAGAGDRVISEMQKATDLRTTIRAAVTARFQLIEENLDAFTILFTEAPRHPELTEMLWHRVVQAEWAKSMPAIDQLVQAGVLPRRPTFLTAGLGMTSLIWSVLALRRPPGGPVQGATADLIDEVTEFVLYGVAGQPQGGTN